MTSGQNLWDWLQNALSVSRKPLFITTGVRFSATGYTKSDDAMIVTVTRTSKSADGIFGTLAVDIDPFKCVTLENMNLEIPAGAWSMLYRWSPDFGQIMPHLIVPNRTAIMAHWANWPKQLSGCIALGTADDFNEDMITESKDAWIKFIEVVTDQPVVTWKIIEDYGPSVTV